MQGEDDDRMPRFSRKSPFALTQKVCPKCLSVLQMGSRLGGWLVPQDYYCTKCGYKGIVYLEKDLNLDGESRS